MKTLRIFAAALIVMSCAIALPATAHETLPTEITNSIGRINYAGFRTRRHCSISLIAADTALTAAHCIAGIAPGQLHVLLGYSKGKWVEHRRVSRVILPSKTQDLALVCLKTPSQQNPLPLRDQPTSDGSKIVAGYPRSRAHILNHQHCISKAYNRQFRLDCPAERGFSGAPLLSMSQGVWQIAGVMSKSSHRRSLAEGIDKQVRLCRNDG